ncbi:MAG: Signal transduction histidine-protein kinase BarA [bacterium ADurb.Bin243]|nr:MAG: Signal transduction histidine-protein kinase BarA [bacterium ADurb.Bin243]
MFLIDKYCLAFLVSLAVVIITIAIVWPKRKMPFARTLLMLLACLAAWSFGAAVDSAVTSVRLKTFITRLEFIPISLAPAFMLIFAFEYTQFYGAARLPLSALWFAAPFLTIAAAFTNDIYHNLLWTGYIPLNDGSNMVTYVKGPFYLYFFMVYSFAYMFIADFLLLFNSLKYVNYFRRQAVTIFFAFLIPWIGAACFIMDINIAPGLDLTPLTFIFMGPILAFAILKMGFLSSAPVVSEMLLKTIDDALLTVDKNGNIIDFNGRAVQIFSAGEGLRASRPVEKLFEDHPQIIQLIRAGKNSRREFMFSADPLLWLEFITSSIEGPGGEALAWLIILRDITSKKTAELNILEAKRAAETANSIKDRFIANMSHELRTPINAMSGFLELISRSGLDAKQSDYINEAIASSRLLLRIVNDILDMSKMGARKLTLEEEEFDVRNIVETSVSLFSSKAVEKKIEFPVFVDSRIPEKLIGDSMRLMQIVNNLLSNAFKFTESGEISLNVEYQGECAGGVRIGFKIGDTGIGIAKDEISRLFVPFTQAEGAAAKKYGGTGLGLSISKEIAAMMSGDISVESEPGKGSVFSFHVVFKPSGPAAAHEEGRGRIASAIVFIENATDRKAFIDYAGAVCGRVDTAFSADEVSSALAKYAVGETPVVIIADLFAMADIIPMSENNKGVSIVFCTPCWQKTPFIAENYGFKCAVITSPLKKIEVVNAILDSAGLSPARAEEPLKKSAFNDVSSKLLIEITAPRVLVVEDNRTNQKLMNVFLKNMGISPELADNGKAAVELVKKESYDIILMDCQMPVMDGYECCGAVRKIEAAGEKNLL